MRYSTLGNSDLQVPAISFGAWAAGGWMWGGTDDAAAIEAMRRAIDLGVTCIDTAPMYGMGHSERLVGRAIRGRRDDVIVATKCGLRWDKEEGEPSFSTTGLDGKSYSVYRNLRPESIAYECEQSLERLGIDTIDLYQCHWPDPTVPIADTMGALAKLRDQGKIRWYGVSNFTVPMLEECIAAGGVTSDQPPYSPLRRDIEADVLPFCREHNIGLLIYSPLDSGLMTGRVTMDRAFPKTDLRHGHPWFQPKNRKRVIDMLEKVRPIAQGHGATLGQTMLAWLLAQPGITTALVGARSPEQVAENAGAADLRLSDEEVATIRGLLDALGGPES